jgi:alpha-L-fucosidase
MIYGHSLEAGKHPMNFTRRQALRMIGAVAPTLSVGRAIEHFAPQSWPEGIDVTPGKYAGTRDSLKSYSVPDWFADAKFGIWSHWGPQSAVGDGDWYARFMYIEGSPQHEYHLKRFGPQSKVGYKDLIPLFTAERWDPDHLIDLYAKAGAKYFVSMGVHHDNFDLWNSKHQPRWNSVAAGPRKDIVGMWAAAARRRGLRFGVSEHLHNSYDWFTPSHLSDAKGPYAGIPYDGANPAFADLYHDYTGETAEFLKTVSAGGLIAPERWKREYFLRVRDLVDQHQPDLLYTDGSIAWEQYGLSTVAELYNVGPTNLRGESEAVYFSKGKQDCAVGTCVLDRERAIADSVWPQPWQTDTCIGQWHYKDGQKYKSAKSVIDLLVEVVSKNGNLLLNFPLPASGELDPEERKILENITAWMSVNAEGIYGTRPWKVLGEGPTVKAGVSKTRFNADVQPDYTWQDLRFTAKGRTLYVFCQGWPPAGEVNVESLATTSPATPEKALNVTMLGRDEALKFVQDRGGLRVSFPPEKPTAADIGIALRIKLV